MTLMSHVLVEVKCLHLNLSDNFRHPIIQEKILLAKVGHDHELNILLIFGIQF